MRKLTWKELRIPLLPILLTTLITIAACSTTPPAPASTANPAAVYCEEQGYVYETRTAMDGNQSGICRFPDGTECEGWAYYRGECQPGGESTEVPPTAEPASLSEDFVPIFEEVICPFNVPSGQVVECGTITVLEDHSNIDSGVIRIAVAIFRDQSDEHQSDPVVLLAGGPGEKVVHKAPALAQVLAPICQNRDLVIFDQRGVGLSEPALDCPESSRVNIKLMKEPDSSAALQATFDAAMACRDRLISEGHQLVNYSTAQNAADVNDIRIALGYDQVNLYGGSYGSLLAQVTMRDYPEGIRSVVLESVVPLEKSLLVDSITTVPQTLLSVLADCAADDACNRAYPRLQDILFEIVDRLNAEPVAVTLINPRDGRKYDAVLTGDAIVGILRGIFYQTRTIPLVPQAIYDVYNDDYALMKKLAGIRLAVVDAISLGMQYSMLCTDDLIGRTAEGAVWAREALPRQLAGTADPEVYTQYGIFGICENWPVEEADLSFRDPLVSDIPTLLLSGEFDPVTPPEYGRLVAANLSNSTFVEFPASGHTGENIGACALGITAAFIDDPTAVPDLSCVTKMPDLAFVLPAKISEIALKPYTNEEMGISGVVPATWNEVQPGTFVRAGSAADVAALQLIVADEVDPQTLLADMARGYGLEQVPESIDEREANDVVWSLYIFESEGATRALALTESQTGTLALVVRSAPSEHAALYKSIFLPMVDALLPVVSE